MTSLRLVCFLFSLLIAQANKALEATLYPRNDVRCFTDLPFGFTNMPRSHERRALQRYKLRACNHYIHQQARDGTKLDDMLDFLPVGLIDLALSRTLEVNSKRKIDDLPERFEIPDSKQQRSALVKRIHELSPQNQDNVKKQLNDLLARYKHGRAPELALYFSSYLLMLKLYKLAKLVPPYRAPCIITLEDDAVTTVAHLHSGTLRHLCYSRPTNHAWELYYFQANSQYYRILAKEHPTAYLRDSDEDPPPAAWSSTAMMWRVDHLPRYLQVIRKEDEDHHWLNCSGRGECVADHFENVKRRIPVTPWVTNPYIDRSTGLHPDGFGVHALSARAMGAVIYTFEWQSFGTAVASLRQWHNQTDGLRLSEASRYDALKSFHRDPWMLSRNLVDAAGQVLIEVEPPKE